MRYILCENKILINNSMSQQSCEKHGFERIVNLSKLSLVNVVIFLLKFLYFNSCGRSLLVKRSNYIHQTQLKKLKELPIFYNISFIYIQY